MLKRSLAANPELSDRQHAAKTGVSHPTAAAVRGELEESGAVSKLDTRVGADGVARPVSKRVDVAARREAVASPGVVGSAARREDRG
ncbi:MAG: hypothetical protein U0904_11505 [Candidatus Nanopelagicales bacterium]|nr:hypothetical protein [Candidatus Nanopelagicales bacterium]